MFSKRTVATVTFNSFCYEAARLGFVWFWALTFEMITSEMRMAALAGVCRPCPYCSVPSQRGIAMIGRRLNKAALNP
eukprot:2493450-Amphidinium_carterae.1